MTNTFSIGRLIAFFTCMIGWQAALAQCGPLTTLYAGNNGQDGIMFDITALQSVAINRFDIDAYGNTHNYEIYHKVGTHVGSENNQGAWTLLGTAGNVAGNPRNSPTAVPITFSVLMCPGETHAFYITSTSTSGSISYTNGTGVGNVAAADANIQIRQGTGKDYPFNTNFTPRIPNLTCYYTCMQSCCEPPAMNATATSCQGACNGSATASTPPGGVGPFTYQWSAATGNQTGQTATNLCSGSYSVTVTDATGCSATSSVVVPSGPPISVPSISAAGPFCSTDAPVNLSASISGGTWSGNGITNALAGTFSPAAAGPGTWTITYTLPGQCGSSTTRSITVNAPPDASIFPAGPFCVSDAPVQLSAATPGGSWSGSGIINSNTGTFSPAIAGVGTWTVQYQIYGACGNFDSESITVTPGTDATITTAGSYCENVDPFTLTALTPGGTWSGPGIVDPATGLWDPGLAGPGNWTITYTIPEPCGDSDNVTLTVTAGADATITPAGPFCLNDAPITLTAADPGGIWAGAGITNTTTGAFSPAAAGIGTWTIVYTIPGACGQSLSTQISVSNGFNATINPVPIQCTTNPPLTLTAANAGGTWSGPGITDPLAGTFDPSVAGPGNHIINYTIPGGCGDSDVRVITVNQGANATINPIPTLCTNSPPINLTAASPGGVWSGTGIINPTAGTFLPAAVSPGNWTITYNITGSCGDLDTEVITIEPVGNPFITPIGPLCADGLNVTLTAATPGGTWSGTGITNPTTGTFSPAVAGPGNWTVSYTLPGACGGTDTEVITVSAPITLNVFLQQESNCGQPDGVVAVSATGGTAPNGYSYAWSTSPPQFTQSAIGLGPGNYAVTVSDDLGCSASSSITVTPTTGFTATVSNTTPTSCTQSCDGSATVSVSSGSTGALTYTWNTVPPQTGATATNLCAGNYNVTVTDNVGCSAIASGTVAAPPSFTATATNSGSPLCFGETATLNVTASGGATPYASYSWSTNPADPSLSNPNIQNPTASPSGFTTYTATVTDANGCTATAQTSVDRGTQILLTPVLVQQSNCGQPDGVATVNVSGGFVDSTYTYLWDTTPTDINDTIFGLVAGTYNVTVTDDVGCSETTSVTVTTSAGFTATIDNQNDVSCFSACDGDATVAVSSGAISPLTYSWNTSPAQTTATATGLCAGSYDVTVTDNTGCTTTATVSIAEPTQLTVTASASITQICEGESSNLTASGSGGTAPLSYAWTAVPVDASLNGSAQNPTVSPAVTTTYTVVVTDANGCSATDQVVVNASPTIVLGTNMDQQSNCGQADGAVSVTATGGTIATDYSYTWNSSPAQTTAVASGLLPGTYSVTVTDDLGCSATATATVTSSAGFTASISAFSDETCFGACDGTATVSASTGTVPPLSYLWNTTPQQNTAAATGLCPGSYDVTITDNTGCAALATVVIGQPTELTVGASAAATAICEGQPVDLLAAASGGSAPLTYSWTATPADPTLNTSVQNPTVTPAVSTTYQVTVTDANGCSVSDQLSVDVSPSITLNAILDQPSNCGQADGVVSVTAIGGTVANDFTYLWNTTPAQSTSTASALLPGNYTVTVTDDVGCTESASVTVTSTAGFTADIGPSADASCYQLCDGSATVTINGNAVAPVSYSWSTAPSQTSATATGLCAGTYDVTVTDNTGCMAMTSVTILEPAAFSVSASSSLSVVCGGQSSDLSVAVNGGSQPIASYNWTANPPDATLTNGIADPSVSPTVSTTYDVVVTDANGCTATDQVTVNVGSAIVLVTSMDQQSSCGQPNGEVSVTATGGTVANDYSYSWDSSPVQTTATATSLPPGTYTVTVTDDIGCSETASVDVTASGGFTASISAQSDATCFQTCDGSATVTADANAVAPFTYSWNTVPVQNTAVATGLCAGTYDVTITDNTGCVGYATATIAEPGVLTATASSSSATVCAGGTAQLDVSAAGGTQPIVSYDWSSTPADPSLNGAIQNPSVTPAVTTTYTVTVTDANGCTASDQITIDIASGLTVNISLDQPADCGQPNGIATATASGGTVANDYAYTWNTSPVQTGASATGLAPGSYTVVAVDDAGCTGTADVTVTTTNGFVTTISDFSNASCFQACDGTATAEVDASAQLPVTFNWNTNPVQTAATATGLCAGTYDVTVTDNAGCVSTASVSIAEPDELTVSATTSQATICDGGSAQLSATASAGAAPLSYSWTAIPADGTLNATDQNPNVSPTANTVYGVTVTDANGCTATDQTTIDISPSITATAAMSQESNCGQADGEATVSAIGGTVVNDYGYSWSTNPAQSTATATGLLPGTYTVTVTDDIGCSSTTDVTITSTAGFTVSITSVTDATCNGTCNGTATVQESAGAVQPVLYAWSSIPPQFTASASGLCAGNYQVLVTDGTGCTATASVTIDEPQPIVVTATASTAAVCIGQSADLSAVASGGTPPVASYSWSASPFDPSLNGGAQNPSVDPTATTTYTVTATDANGCIATDQVTVSVLPALSLSISSPTSGSDTTICPGGTATISLEASGGDGNYSFYLQPDILNPISLPMMVQPSSATTYEFVVSDGCGTPPALASSTISIYGLPTISVSGFESGCHPHTVELADNTTPAPASWSWNFGDPQSNSNTSSQSAPSHTFSGPGTYDIVLTIETAEGCTVDTVFSNAVEVYAPPTADFSHNPTSVTTVDGQVSFTDESSTNVDSWYWNFGTGDTALTQNPQYTFNDTGTYVVWLTVSTADGCQAVARGTVRVEPSFTFYVPNSFTPDRDGINDRFRGYGEGVNWDTYEIRVFTRWGEEIFYSNSIDLPWDATFKGSPVEVGVYVWTINVEEVSGRMHYYRGHVNVIR